jgi:hypothetical protein
VRARTIDRAQPSHDLELPGLYLLMLERRDGADIVTRGKSACIPESEWAPEKSNEDIV